MYASSLNLGSAVSDLSHIGEELNYSETHIASALRNSLLKKKKIDWFWLSELHNCSRNM